ncbi:ParB/RepB/Spo0J family partition protein [Gordonia amicalis]|uniref:ParB/RepB/Spo0J family partition protein n=1 Tax=Gordonia amicalis TaxID=89053 RepID=A0ABU4DJS0_9ACTN|nr:ParB/RepB/Spo0J family partition protein [Gordonia amicalis]MDV6309990.1 ParB/RepB/Spo0J family partition protein [Gordonia amicalis]
MARKNGGRVDLSSLASSVGVNSTVDPTAAVDGIYRSNVRIDELAPNPRNPRSDLGDLADLESIRDRQLQPATAISRSAWLRLYPEDQDVIRDAQYVIVNGCRRLAAARKFGREGLDMVIRDGLAADKATLLWAAIAENLERQDFDVIEEAHAVEAMVAELGSAKAAAERLNRTEGWVSQRRTLLQLDPELQAKLRSGELAVRHARTLAKVPMEEQVAAWQAANEKREKTTEQGEGGSKQARTPEHSSAAMKRALKRFKAEPRTVAIAIREVWPPEDIDALIEQLRDRG